MSTHIAASGIRLFLAIALFAILFGLTLGITMRILPAGANHTGSAVHACANNSTGAIRKVSSPNHCRSYEHSLVLGHIVGGFSPILQNSGLILPGNVGEVTAQCPDGLHAIGGGVSNSPLQDGTSYIQESQPAANFTGWRVKYFNGATSNSILNVWAMCAYTDLILPDPF